MNNTENIENTGLPADFDAEKFQQIAIGHYIKVAEVNTKINVILTLVQQTDFSLVQNMIESTPAEEQDNANFKTLTAVFELFEKLEDIYKVLEENQNKIII